MISNASPGKFITIEGVDAVGKSTLITNLKEYFAEKKINTVYTQEPGGTEIATQLRSILLGSTSEQLQPFSELLLIVAARIQHNTNLIKPNLERNKWVVSDRYFDSTFAYQGYGRGIDAEQIEELHSNSDMLIPDLTLLLHNQADTNSQRSSDRNWNEVGSDVVTSRTMPLPASKANQLELGFIDRFENESMRFKERVTAGFLARAEEFPERIFTIDAAQTIEDVFNAAVEQIEQLHGSA